MVRPVPIVVAMVTSLNGVNSNNNVLTNTANSVGNTVSNAVSNVGNTIGNGLNNIGNSLGIDSGLTGGLSERLILQESRQPVRTE